MTVFEGPIKSVSERTFIDQNTHLKKKLTIPRYKLAEKLQDRLNELNKDLTEMIEEINNTSQMLSKTGKPDDPVRFHLLFLIPTLTILFVSPNTNITPAHKSRPRPQLPTLTVAAHRLWRHTAQREDPKGPERKPARGRQWLEWPGN